MNKNAAMSIIQLYTKDKNNDIKKAISPLLDYQQIIPINTTKYQTDNNHLVAYGVGKYIVDEDKIRTVDYNSDEFNLQLNSSTYYPLAVLCDRSGYMYSVIPDGTFATKQDINNIINENGDIDFSKYATIDYVDNKISNDIDALTIFAYCGTVTKDAPTQPNDNEIIWKIDSKKIAIIVDEESKWSITDKVEGDYVWMTYSIQKKNGNYVTKWSNPICISQKFDVDLSDIKSSFISFAFTRTNDNISDKQPTGGNYNNPLPNDSEISWYDSIPEGEESIWMTKCEFCSDDNNGEWSYPVKMSDTTDFEVIYSPLLDKNNIPEGFKRINNSTEIDSSWLKTANDAGWYDDPSNFSGKLPIWMATITYHNGVWDNWKISKIKGEDGNDGTSITMKGHYPTYEELIEGTKDISHNIGDAYTVEYINIDGSGNIIIPEYNDSTNTWDNSTDTSKPGKNNALFVWDGDSWVFSGTFGASAFIHIKYANDADATDNETFNATINGIEKTLKFTEPNGENPGKYIGIYADNNEDDSLDSTLYKWSKWEGDDGFGYEYVYCCPPKGSIPSLPNYESYINDSSYQVFDFIPGITDANYDWHDTNVNNFTWSDNRYSVTADNPVEYMCYRRYVNNKFTNFAGTSDNSVIITSVYGADGEPGKDSYATEYIYCLALDDSSTYKPSFELDNSNNQILDSSNLPNNDNGNNKNPWTHSPSGISEENKVEYVSIRTYDTSTSSWSEYSEPAIWSIWGSKGQDGDGVEYIFTASDNSTSVFEPLYTYKNEMKHESEDSSKRKCGDEIISIIDFVPGEVWTTEFKKTDKYETLKNEYGDIVDRVLLLFDGGWVDDAIVADESNPFVYVCIRKRKNISSDKVIYEYGTPKIWNRYTRDGYSSYTEFLFAADARNLTIYKVEGGSYNNSKDVSTYDENDEPVDVSWHDTVPPHDPVTQNIYMVKGFVKEDGSPIDWSSPVKMVDSGYMQVEYSCIDSSTPPVPLNLSDIINIIKVDKPNYTLDELETTFRAYDASDGRDNFEWKDSSELLEEDSPIWMIVSTYNNSEWSDWVVSRIKGEKGDPGAPGQAAYHIELTNEFDQVYTRNNEIILPIDDSGDEVKQCVSTYIQIFEGNTDITKHFTADNISVKSDRSDIVEPILYNDSVGILLEVDFNAGTVDSSVKSFDIIIDVSKNGYTIPSKTFKIIKINGTVDYDLNVTPTVIKVDSTGKPDPSVITVGITERDVTTNGSELKSLDTVPPGFILNYLLDGSNKSTITAGNNIPTIDVSSSTTDKRYTIELLKNDQIIDKVHVELLRDGAKGDKGDTGNGIQIAGTQFKTMGELMKAYEYYYDYNKNGGSTSLDKPNPYFNFNDNYTELSTGDAYLVGSDLYVYSGNNEEDFNVAWTVIQNFKGAPGDSYYLYIAYSNDGSTFTYPNASDGSLYYPYGSTPGKYIGLKYSSNSLDTSVKYPYDSSHFGDFAWTKWEGEDGFGKEQIFILSDSSVVSVPMPMNFSYSDASWNEQDFQPDGWSDTPLTPETDKRYCLMAVRNYPPKQNDISNGYNLFKGDASNNAIIFSYLAEDGSDGTSPFHIELSNEFDQVYTQDGKILSNQCVSTNIQLYRGSENITGYLSNIENESLNDGSKIDVSDDNSIYATTLSYNEELNAIHLDVSFIEDVSLDNDIDIDITIYGNDEINLDYPIPCIFKIKRINGTVDYDLLINPTIIVIDSSGTYSHEKIDVSVIRRELGGKNANNEILSVIEASKYGCEIKYTIDSSSDVSLNDDNGIDISSATKYCKVELLKDGVQYDVATVELVRDGKDGSDAVNGYHVELSNDFDLIQTNNYYTESNQTVNTRVQLFCGGTNVDISTIGIDLSDASLIKSININDTNINGDSSSYDITVGSDSCDIRFDISGNVEMIDTYNILITVKELNGDVTMTKNLVLKPINSAELYQLVVTPGFVTKRNDNTIDTDITARIYKKTNYGIQYIDSSTISNIPKDSKIILNYDDLSTAIYLDSSNIDHFGNIMLLENGASVNTDKIEIQLSIGTEEENKSNIHDIAYVEVKENVLPLAVFDMTPLERIVYVDASGKPIDTSLRYSTSFMIDGKAIYPKDCSISVYDSSLNGKLNYYTIDTADKYTYIDVTLNFEDNDPLIGEQNYLFKINHDGNTYYKAFSITYVQSTLTVSSINDTINIYPVSKSEYYSAILPMTFNFNGKYVDSSGVKVNIDTSKYSEDSSMHDYVNVDDNIIIQNRNGTWYANFKCGDGYDILTYLNDTPVNDCYLYVTVEYENISASHKFKLISSSNNTYRIHTNSLYIDDSSNPSAIEVYFTDNDGDYVSHTTLMTNGIKFNYCIDDDATFTYDNVDMFNNHPKQRGNYAFYPNGYIIPGDEGEEIPLRPILKNIKFKLYDSNNNIIDYQQVERINYIPTDNDSVNIIVKNNEETIDLSEYGFGEERIYII